MSTPRDPAGASCSSSPLAFPLLRRPNTQQTPVEALKADWSRGMRRNAAHKTAPAGPAPRVLRPLRAPHTPVARASLAKHTRGHI